MSMCGHVCKHVFCAYTCAACAPTRDGVHVTVCVWVSALPCVHRVAYARTCALLCCVPLCVHVCRVCVKECTSHVWDLSHTGLECLGHCSHSQGLCGRSAGRAGYSRAPGSQRAWSPRLFQAWPASCSPALCPVLPGPECSLESWCLWRAFPLSGPQSPSLGTALPPPAVQTSFIFLSLVTAGPQFPCFPCCPAGDLGEGEDCDF